MIKTTGIARRTILLTWIVTVMTLAIFVAVLLPEQKRDLRAGLESKAAGVAVALQGEVAEAAVTEDYSSVVEHAMQVLNGDKAVDFLVITKNDGLSLVVERNGWHMEPKTDRYWFPTTRQPWSELGIVPVFQRRVFHYAVPFDYSSIQWGWIHVGLSLDAYDASARRVNLRTGLLAVLCVFISLIASTLYAGRFVRPILKLQAVVEQVAGGNLLARAEIHSRDEIERLADSFNSMADTILHRNQELSEAKRDLEMRVQERTWDLEKEVLERTAAEAAMRSAKEAAEVANHAKSDFLANMSHEIRTPLNGVIGMTALALDSLPDEQQREYLETIQLSADSLLAVINDILDFSKIEAGRMDLESVEFNLRNCLESTLRPLALNADRKGLELMCEIASEIPELVQGDPMRLTQVVTNLVGNAIKFTHVGEVVLTAALSDRKNSPPDIHFTISDTGIGIPAEKLQAIFAPFAQADTSTTRQYGGTGLGLAICTRLVSMMGGRVWVQSQLDQGSTFHFTARLKFHSGNAIQRTHDQYPELQNVRVLVVDDNRTNLRILTETLTLQGVRVQGVESGERALSTLLAAQVGDDPFRLLLTDLSMPQMDGFDLIERVQEGPELRPALILMLSSKALQENLPRFRELAIPFHLVKPVRQGDLFATMAKALRGDVPAPPLPLSSTRKAATTSNGLFILLAEDNLVNQRVATSTLEKMGHSVVIANNGLEVMSMLARSTFDLILMDIQMPEMDGFTTSRAIREEETKGRSRTPIVAMTAHNMSGDRERCLAAGMDGFVAKPILRKELEKEIAAALNGRREKNRSAEMDDLEESPTLQEPPVWEPQRALKLLSGDEDLLWEVIDIFLNEAPKALLGLREALADRNGEAVQRIAHSLKSEMSYLGLATVQNQAHALEEAGKGLDFQAAKGLVERLEIEIPLISDSIQQVCLAMKERRLPHE